ncbi:MAG: uroporphyrinogen decarboxylase family protein [Desulfobacterales bacterium]|jgi:uroporphyrinogen-III decarboxylase
MLDVSKDYSSFQEGVRRFENAMAGIPDRVPVVSQIHEFAMRQLGIPAKEFYTNPEILAAGTLEVQEKYGIDVPVLDYDVYNIEAEAIGQEVKYSEHDMPDVDRTKPLICGRDDLNKIRTPDFGSDGRFPKVVEMNRIFRKLIGGSEITIRFCAPFSLAANIRGLEQLLMDIYMDPDFVRDMFDRIVEEVLAPWILHLKKVFPRVKSISGDDAYGSLPIVNPDIIREWIVPYVLRLRELCGPEIYVPNWVGENYLKNPLEMLDLKFQVCPGFIEGQDPDVAELGPELYKAYAEKKNVPLILGIGAAFLASSPPEEIRERVRHYIEVGGKDGRFALLLCNIGATTPPENVYAAIDAVYQYGDYR